jgi:predicted transposase YdaD
MQQQTLTMITSFYDSGYQDGFAHGRIHGLIEGRALGREKGFEMWEEIGFYEGFALTWRAILRQQSKEDELS